MHDHIRIMDRCFHDRIQIDDTFVQQIQLGDGLVPPRRRVDAHRVSEIAESDPEQTGFHDPAVDERAFRFRKEKVFPAAVLEHIGGGQIARIDQHDLAVFQMRHQSFDQLLVEIGLDVDDDDVFPPDFFQVPADFMDAGGLDPAKLVERHFAVMLDQIIEVIVMHGMRRFDQCYFVSFQRQICCDRTSRISGSYHCDFHVAPLSVTQTIRPVCRHTAVCYCFFPLVR